MLARLPLEIIDAIAFELTALQPLGPPYVLLPLLSTCVQLHHALSTETNPGLYARIFRYKFDSGAVERRAFRPEPVQCVEQLIRYCDAMQVLRRADPYAGTWGSVEDVGLEDALMTAVIMMMEDDGKNGRQLIEWAGIERVVGLIVRKRMYEESYLNDGWPVENRRNACALWLMWMLTTEESLRAESPQERAQIIQLLLPFVTVPYRYPSFEAPTIHFNLPLPHHPLTLPLPPPTSIQTVHGPYPVYPSLDRTYSEVHYASRPTFTVPLLAPAAKLLFFSRREMTPIPTPPHLAENRRAWLERGNVGVGPTREDVDEFNWGWSARLPYRRRMVRSSGGDDHHDGWVWGVGDHEELLNPIIREEKDVRSLETSGEPSSSSSGSESRRLYQPHPRWVGKAPHTSLSTRSRPKSAKWDADWWRSRLCGNLTRTRPRVPYGKVYEPGCMDGLWHGRMVTPAETELQALLNLPNHPPHGEFTEGSLRNTMQPIYMRLREAHSIVGGDSSNSTTTTPGNVDVDLGTGVQGVQASEGMVNAWFDGATGSTTVRVRSAGGVTGTAAGTGEPVDKVEIRVQDAAGRVRSAVYPCWRRRRRAAGLGNAAEEAGVVEEEEEDVRYEHDEDVCDECVARKRMRSEVEREKEERERIFAGVGLGLGDRVEEYEDEEEDEDMEDDEDDEVEEDDGDDDDNEDTSSSDLDQDEWDHVHTPTISADGTIYPELPRAHSRSKLGVREKCTGIRDIFLFGETDERHGDAFGRYVFYGRVRAWDGLVGILRRCVGDEGEGGEGEGGDFGYMLFYGYVVGGDNFVGSWRIPGGHGPGPVWEGPFCMSRRVD